MSDDQQPRAEWIFPEEKKSNTGRIWLIVILSVVAVAIVAALLFFFLPRADGTPDATPSPTPTASRTASPTATPTPTPTATASPTPSPSPSEDSEPTPPASPPPPDPDLETFTAQVQGPLDDGLRGLDLVQGNMDVGGQIVDSLQQDAQKLAGAAAPSSLADGWSAAVADYTARLGELRAALDSGADAQPALDASRASLGSLRSLVGL